MFGVIIWSDPGASSAVIWCEEKRSLAYYDAARHENVPPSNFFDAGDYVEFDLVDEDRRWMAVNARTIVLPSNLSLHGRADPAQRIEDAPPGVATGAEVIQFSDHVGQADAAAQRDRLNRRG